MREELLELLRFMPSLKVREISKRLNLEKKDLNAFLYRSPDVFVKDINHRWSLCGQKIIRIELDEGWVDSSSFEKSLVGVGSPLDIDCTHVIFIIPHDCKLLLDAAARLLALCNQLNWQKKYICVDFNDCASALAYFDRMGFFEHLHPRVSVLPARPIVSRAHIYNGNNIAVVEFGAIDPVRPDETLPKKLKQSFVSLVGKNEYSQPAFTVISELFGNVRDHSESEILGFAALQLYNGKRPHIQTVVSDSGKGIIGTLRPILESKYPKLARKFPLSNRDTDALLLKEVFEHGHISCSTDEARGLGLKQSREVAAKFNATISVRQENFELILQYKSGELVAHNVVKNMPKILGTHICFDFLLDGFVYSG